MNLTKIGNLEAIALLLIVSTNHLLLNMPQTIIDTCGSASLLNIIYSTILVFIIAYILLFLLHIRHGIRYRCRRSQMQRYIQQS